MEKLQQQLAALPDKPGVYIFHDAHGEVLYVGKAKVLKNRVRSYFQSGATLEPAKEQMVPLVAHVDTISCDSEHEALILEANLIRKHKPPYNVVLTDDKYYLFIKITADPLPRVYPVRKLARDGARYFGPYSSASAVRHTLKLLRRLFPHFGESYNEKTWLFPHPLFANDTGDKQRVTQPPLKSFGGQARQGRLARRSHAAGETKAGPAGIPVDVEQYRDNIQNVISFLEGKRGQIIDRLRAGMQQAAREKSFERAALWRDQLRALERLEGAQKVYLPRAESFDVVSIVTRHTQSAANVFAVRDGKLLNKNTFLLKHRSAAALADVLRQFLLQYYRVAQDIPPVLLLPVMLPDQAAIAQWINQAKPPALLLPQRGKKRQLMRMGELNASQLLAAEEVHFASRERTARATGELARAIGMADQELTRIETYDISNIQGTLATGSMVVFIDGQASKQHYKKFRIKGLTSPNDFLMLQQVLSRRFSNRHPDWMAPDLIIVDGGKGQLTAAKKILDELGVSSTVIALAKKEEVLFAYAAQKGEKPPLDLPLHQGKKIREICLPFDSDALYLLQRMRDEAHRFTVSYHRLLRSKRQQHSLLDEVPGIGPKLKKRLLAHFGSLKGIREASEEELRAALGPAKTKTLREYL